MLRSRGFSAIGAIAGALVLGFGSIAGCSLVLDFDDPPAPPDAVTIDAIPAAACDFHEPNDSRATAMALEPIEGQSAGICTGGDHDFYAIAVAAGQQMTFEILFDQPGSNGDLELVLFDDTGATVARSLSTNSDEEISCPGSTGARCATGLAAGNYFLEVYGFAANTTNAYTINYTLTGP